MAFVLVKPLVDKIDAISTGYVATMSEAAITAISPVVSSGLTISFIVFSLLIMRGAVDVPAREFLTKCLKTVVVCAFAMGGGIYQTNIAAIITSLPDDLASAIVTGGTATNAGELIDMAAGSGFDVAGAAWDLAGFSGDGFVYALFGLVVATATSIVVAVGAALVILAKLALGILAGLGPIFIFALLFEATAKLFESWIGQVLNYVLLVVIFSAVFIFLVDIFANYMGDMKLDGTQNIAYALGGSLILAIGILVVLLQIPSMAGALAQGVGLNLSSLRSVKGGANSASDAMYSKGRLKDDGTRGPASGALPAVGRGASRAKSYFKGKAGGRS